MPQGVRRDIPQTRHLPICEFIVMGPGDSRVHYRDTGGPARNQHPLCICHGTGDVITSPGSEGGIAER